MILCLEFSVSRHVNPRVEIADAYWSFRPVTPASVECFVRGHLPGLQRDYGRAVARSAARLERLSAETPVLGFEVAHAPA